MQYNLFRDLYKYIINLILKKHKKRYSKKKKIEKKNGDVFWYSFKVKFQMYFILIDWEHTIEEKLQNHIVEILWLFYQGIQNCIYEYTS